MYRHEHYISVLICYFHYLPHAALFIVHAHQAAENAYAVVNVHNVIPEIEGVQVVDGELLALFHRTPDANPVETVEYLVVCVARDLRIFIHESLMDILPFHKLRQYSSLARNNGLYPVQLGGLLSIYIYFVSRFFLAADIIFKQVEVLVEARLGGDVIFLGGCRLDTQWNLQEYPAELFRENVEVLLFIYVRRIEPDGGVLRDYLEQVTALPADFGERSAYYVRTIPFSFGNLGVAVKYVDTFYLIAPEGNTVGFVIGIGEYVYQGSPDCELAGRRNEVTTLEPHPAHGFYYGIEGYFLSFSDCQYIFFSFSAHRNTFFEGIRAAYHEYLPAFILENGGDGCRPLDTDGRFIVTPLYSIAARREKENFVSFCQLVKVRSAIFRTFFIG